MAKKEHTVEGYGNKGMKNTSWRKSFPSTEHMMKWVEKNDADVLGTRDIEAAKRGSLSPALSVREKKFVKTGKK